MTEEKDLNEKWDAIGNKIVKVLREEVSLGSPEELATCIRMLAHVLHNFIRACTDDSEAHIGIVQKINSQLTGAWQQVYLLKEEVEVKNVH
jgi:hypothetical protein